MSLGDSFYSRLSMSLGATGLRWTGKLNVPLYRLSGGRLLGRVNQAPVLLLTTTGRRRRRVRARIAGGAERAELWRKNVEQYAGFDRYVEILERTPSVFVLEPR